MPGARLHRNLPDPRPMDKNVPSSFLQNIVFNHFMYSKQEYYEGQAGEIRPD